MASWRLACEVQEWLQHVQRRTVTTSVITTTTTTTRQTNTTRTNKQGQQQQPGQTNTTTTTREYTRTNKQIQQLIVPALHANSYSTGQPVPAMYVPIHTRLYMGMQTSQYMYIPCTYIIYTYISICTCTSLYIHTYISCAYKHTCVDIIDLRGGPPPKAVGPFECWEPPQLALPTSIGGGIDQPPQERQVLHKSHGHLIHWAASLAHQIQKMRATSF